MFNVLWQERYIVKQDVWYLRLCVLSQILVSVLCLFCILLHVFPRPIVVGMTYAKLQYDCFVVTENGNSIFLAPIVGRCSLL